MIPPAVRTVGALLEDATRRLQAAHVAEPRREAVALVALALGTDRGGVMARKADPAPPAAADVLERSLDARERRVPLQHIAGTVEFRGREYVASPDALIPRPETEDLVQVVLDAGLPDRARVADLGTGSGCIAIALAVERPLWCITAVDLSPSALRVASANAARHGVEGRVAMRERDFARVPADERGLFHAVVSNPPYVPEEEWRGLQAEVRDHEPKLALVPGPTGHEAYAAVVGAATSLLAPGGLLAFELGWKSEEAVRRLAAEAGFETIATRPDLQGISRVLTARWRSPLPPTIAP